MTADRALQIALAVLDANPALLPYWSALKPGVPKSGVSSWR